MTTSLAGKVALVTGGGVRVGRAICLALAQRGAHVAFTHLTCEECLLTADEIAAFGVEALPLTLDVREPGAPAEVVQQVIARFGRLDLLVNNASVWLKAPFLEITPEAWQTALDVNLTGPFLLSQAVAPQMLKQQSGLIINITDLSAYQTWSGYAASRGQQGRAGRAHPRHGRRAGAVRARQRDRARHGPAARGRARVEA